MRDHSLTNETPDACDESEYGETFTLAGLEREKATHASETGPDGLDAMLQALNAGFLDGADEFAGLPEMDAWPNQLAGKTRGGAWITRENDANSIEAFLTANTIVCAGLRARITRSQCRHNALSGTVPCCAACPRGIASCEVGVPALPDEKTFKGERNVDFH